MRAAFFALGAILLTTYPVVLLFSLAGKLDQSQQKMKRGAIVLSVGMSGRSAEGEARESTRRVLRNPTIRRNSSGH